jgi:hypothetical protein
VTLIEWFDIDFVWVVDAMAMCWLFSLFFYDVRMRTLSEKERILVRISKRKKELMIHEDEVQGHIANKGKPPLDAYLILIVLLLHYYRFYKLHVFYLFMWVVISTRSFIIPPLRVLPLVDTYWTILVAIWCLTPYPLFVAAFQIKLDYTLGALLKKEFGKRF